MLIQLAAFCVIFLISAFTRCFFLVQVLPFDDNLCIIEPCLNLELCSTVLLFGEAADVIASEWMLFRPIHPRYQHSCSCPLGFTGSAKEQLCDVEVNLCYSNPCHNNATCQQREGGFTCLCSERFTGEVTTFPPRSPVQGLCLGFLALCLFLFDVTQAMSPFAFEQRNGIPVVRPPQPCVCFGTFQLMTLDIVPCHSSCIFRHLSISFRFYRLFNIHPPFLETRTNLHRLRFALGKIL